MNTYEAFVKVPISSTRMLPTIVQVQAINMNAARGIVIAQYGAANIIHYPMLVRN